MEDIGFGNSGDAAKFEDEIAKYFPKEKITDYELKYLLYGANGGFYKSNFFSRSIRRTWYGIVAIPACFLVGLEIILIKNWMAGNEDYADTSSAIILHAGLQGIVYWAFLLYVTHYFRKEVEWGLLQNEHRPAEIESLKRRTDLKDINKVILNIHTLCTVFYVIILVGHITLALITVTSPEELKEAKWQMLPNPFAAFIETEVEFVCLTTLLCIPIIILLFGGLHDSLFFLAITREYYSSMALIWTNIEHFSEKATIAVENLNERFAMNEISQLQESDYTKLLEIERGNLFDNIKSAAFLYQQHTKNIEMIFPYFKIKFTCKMICDVIILIIIVTALYSDSFPLVQKLKAALMFPSVACVWFCDCYVGKILSDMGETMEKKVMIIPWYYLDPAHRKVYHIFQCMAQQRITIRALGLYESGMPIFLQILKHCYTYFNFLRAEKM